MRRFAPSRTILLCLICLLAAVGSWSASALLGGGEAASLERIDEAAFRAVAQFFEYDPSIPLEARTVEKRDGKSDDAGAVREKIVFRGTQGFLVPGYLELPKTEAARYPCVLLLHGWSGSKTSWWEDDNYMSGGNVRRALLESGFAVLALDAQCHGDRAAQNDFAPVNHYQDPTSPRKGYFTLPEIYVQTTKDYRRAIDYLESRPEIDAGRIGTVGYSMGGTQTFLLTAVEPRVKVAVACVVPSQRDKWSPVAPQNYARGIGSRPLLMIMGQTDPLSSAEDAEALYKLVESPATKLMMLDAGHSLPADYVPHAAEWMKKHLGSEHP